MHQIDLQLTCLTHCPKVYMHLQALAHCIAVCEGHWHVCCCKARQFLMATEQGKQAALQKHQTCLSQVINSQLPMAVQDAMLRVKKRQASRACKQQGRLRRHKGRPRLGQALLKGSPKQPLSSRVRHRSVLCMTCCNVLVACFYCALACAHQWHCMGLFTGQSVIAKSIQGQSCFLSN